MAKKDNVPSDKTQHSRANSWAWTGIIQRYSLDKLIILIVFLLFLSFTVDPFIAKMAKTIDPAVIRFFRILTKLGKSEWTLVPSGVVMLGAFYIACRRGYARSIRAAAIRVMYGAGFMFVSIAGSGILSQVIKNLVGRPRPKLMDSLGPFEFVPFQFDSDFSSFPSGHSTTVFAFAAAVSMLRPPLAIVAYVSAVWIAASRVIINAHYLSDIIAGAVLGVMFTYYLQRKYAAKRWAFEYDRDASIRLRT